MDDNALGFASYWRNSLADAESGKGSFERKDAKNFTHWHGIAAGRLDETIVGKFFEGEKDDVETVDVILRPKVYFRLLQRGKDHSAGAPDIVTPIVTPALLSREGFYIRRQRPPFPETCLNLCQKGHFQLVILGSMINIKRHIPHSLSTLMTALIRPPKQMKNEKHDMQPGSRIGVNIWMIQRSY